MKKIILLVLISAVNLFGQPYDPSWGSGNGPEIYTCIFGYGNFIDWQYPNQANVLGIRVHMEAIGDYWVQDGVGGFTRENNGNVYSDLFFPKQIYTQIPDGLDSFFDDMWTQSFWISTDYRAQETLHAWYGFEFQNENISSQLDDFADGIYKLSIEVLSYHDEIQDFDTTSVGYFYLDCRDSQLGYYQPVGIHNIDIWIKFDMPIKNGNGSWTGKEGSFKINVGDGIFRQISEHQTVRYWELKGVTGPTETLDFTYLSQEVPQNFHITGGYNSHPTLIWDQVTNAESYHIYRALEDNDGIYSYKLIGSTTSTTWTDNEVTKQKFGNAKYHYNVTTEMLVNNTPIGYETIPSDTLIVTGDGPIYKSGSGNTAANSILKFKLANYPNPFNPSTVINFTLPEDAKASIKIYNAVGKEVAVLVNNNLAKGEYQVYFDAQSAAGGLSSGIYYAQLKAGTISKTIKIIYEK